MDLCIKEIIKDSKQTLSLGWLKAPPKDPDWSRTYTQREVQKLTLVNSYPELISCLAAKDKILERGVTGVYISYLKYCKFQCK